jgi:hypothetical protein
MRPQHWLYIILILAFILRIGGLFYGLPLWLVGDEPALVTGALKMLELKTLLPFLHQEELKATLYFPPHLSYLYLAPFAMLTGIEFIFFHGSFAEFKNYLIGDLSNFFILERTLHLLFSLFTVWLVYRTAKNIFKEERPALLATAFLATSVIHIYSAFYHWGPAIFMFTLALNFLTDERLPARRRYLLGAVIAGAAFGVSLIAGFIMLFMLYWYLFYEKHSVSDAVREKFLYAALLIFILLAGLSIALYPYGFHLSGDHSLGKAKSFTGYLSGVWHFFTPLVAFEPAISLLAAIGLFYAYRHKRGYFYTAILFLFSYASVFYGMYHYELRFTSYLFPILAITAGYGTHWLTKDLRRPLLRRLVLLIIFILPIITALQFIRLELQNDPRISARRWAELNIPAGSKIITYAELMRLSSNQGAAKEQATIDPRSLRKIDLAEAQLPAGGQDPKRFHALNLYTVTTDNFWNDIGAYARAKKYQYLIWDPNFLPPKPWQKEQLERLAASGTLLESFGVGGQNFIMRDGYFPDIIKFLRLNSLSPQVNIYELQQN